MSCPLSDAAIIKFHWLKASHDARIFDIPPDDLSK